MSQVSSPQSGIFEWDIPKTARRDQLSIANIGSSAPLGATVTCGGVNFSLYSRDATRIELLFFDHADDALPSRNIHLDASIHRTYHYWHVFISDAQAGQLYGYRVHGPLDPVQGMRFDP